MPVDAATTHIYHITHIENLQDIVQNGGLHCSEDERGRPRVRLGHPHIKERRGIKQVPCGPQGPINQYVPFYFAPRSPMLYAVYSGRVDPALRQADVVYLVSTVARIQELQLLFVFTDGHAAMVYSEFFDHVDRLDRVDWEVMRLQYWNGSDEIKFKRQAEFLIHQFCPLAAVTEVVTFDANRAQRVHQLLQLEHQEIRVRAENRWYF